MRLSPSKTISALCFIFVFITWKCVCIPPACRCDIGWRRPSQVTITRRFTSGLWPERLGSQRCVALRSRGGHGFMRGKYPQSKACGHQSLLLLHRFSLMASCSTANRSKRVWECGCCFMPSAQLLNIRGLLTSLLPPLLMPPRWAKAELRLYVDSQRWAGACAVLSVTLLGWIFDAALQLRPENALPKNSVPLWETSSSCCYCMQDFCQVHTDICWTIFPRFGGHLTVFLMWRWRVLYVFSNYGQPLLDCR